MKTTLALLSVTVLLAAPRLFGAALGPRTQFLPGQPWPDDKGAWKELPNPCAGVNPHNRRGPELTFGGQSTCILPVAGIRGAFIAMFDLWRPDDAIAGGYVWLPMTFGEDRFTITWRDAWDLSVFGK